LDLSIVAGFPFMKVEALTPIFVTLEMDTSPHPYLIVEIFVVMMKPIPQLNLRPIAYPPIDEVNSLRLAFQRTN